MRAAGVAYEFKFSAPISSKQTHSDTRTHTHNRENLCTSKHMPMIKYKFSGHFFLSELIHAQRSCTCIVFNVRINLPLWSRVVEIK